MPPAGLHGLFALSHVLTFSYEHTMWEHARATHIYVCVRMSVCVCKSMKSSSDKRNMWQDSVLPINLGVGRLQEITVGKQDKE